MSKDHGRGQPSDRVDSVTRRSLLRKSGVAAGALATGIGLSGSATSQAGSITYYEDYSRDRGTPGTPAKWNAIHVDAITLSNSTATSAFYDGISRGLSQLYEELGDWFAGYRLRCYQIDAEADCTNRVDSMAGILDDVEETPDALGTDDLDDPNRHYHFAPRCEMFPGTDTQSPRRPFLSPWGDRGDDAERPISSVGHLNTALNDWILGGNAFRVRTIHQALHMFVDRSLAKQMTGVDNGYEASHTLGTVQSDGERTVMADLALANIPDAVADRIDAKEGYEDEARAGGVCGSDHSGNTTWPRIDDLGFSECTKYALHASALRNSDASVVENWGSNFGRTLGVDVTVTDGDGHLVPDTEVRLTDLDSQHRTGTTGSNGHVLFWEQVGPPSCNSLDVSLPEHGVTRDIGCHNGGKIIEVTIAITESSGDSSDHGGSDENGGGSDDGNGDSDSSGDSDDSSDDESDGGDGDSGADCTQYLPDDGTPNPAERNRYQECLGDN